MYTTNDKLSEILENVKIDIIRSIRRVVKEEIEIYFSDSKDEKYYSVEEAGSLLGLSNNTIYNRIRSGQIQTKRSGRKYVISKSEIQKSLNYFSN